EALAGLFLLVRCEDRFGAELDALGLGVGPAARGALQDATALQFRSDTENGEDDLRKVGRGVEVRFSQRTAMAPGRCISRATTGKWVVSGGRRSTAGVIPPSPGQAVSSACQAAAARPSCR